MDDFRHFCTKEKSFLKLNALEISKLLFIYLNILQLVIPIFFVVIFLFKLNTVKITDKNDVLTDLRSFSSSKQLKELANIFLKCKNIVRGKM